MFRSKRLEQREQHRECITGIESRDLPAALHLLAARDLPGNDLDAVQARVLVCSARGNRPDLTGWKWVAANAVLAVQLGGNDELLDAFLAQMVAEVRVAKLG